MIEAVGYDFWEEYFAILDQVLAPGGRVGIQAITMRHDRMLATRNTYTWINKYIFPGGFLPSVEVIERDHPRAHRRCGSPTGCRSARTTPRPCGSGTSGSSPRATQVLALGFDETFVRMWHFYLEYSRAGFASGYLDVNQIVLRAKEVRMTATGPADADAVRRRAPRSWPRPPSPFVGGELPVRLRAWDG